VPSVIVANTPKGRENPGFGFYLVIAERTLSAVGANRLKDSKLQPRPLLTRTHTQQANRSTEALPLVHLFLARQRRARFGRHLFELGATALGGVALGFTLYIRPLLFCPASKAPVMVVRDRGAHHKWVAHLFYRASKTGSFCHSDQGFKICR
jgi:hypothetical protein